MAGDRWLRVVTCVRTALECPFSFDLFESFAELVQAKGTSESDTERFLIGGENGKMALLAEGVHRLQFAGLEFLS